MTALLNEWLLDPNRRPLIVGVLNVTPDSFSDGGRFADPEAALAQAHRLVAEGADVLDVGAESTRPGAVPVDAAVERARLLPVLRRLAAELPAVMSLMTRAPASSAASATAARVVSMLSTAPTPRSADITGSTRRICSRASTGSLPGRVDSPPMSIQSAP